MTRPTRIVSTELKGLSPLGNPDDRSYERLSVGLARRFGPGHTALFAEPEPFADSSAIDWYAPGGSGAVPLGDLDRRVAERVDAELVRLSDDLRAYAAELAGPGRTGAERSLAVAIGNALQVPGRDYIYAIGEQPVLVAWAHRLETRPALSVGLVHRGTPASQVLKAGVPRPGRRGGAQAPAATPGAAAAIVLARPVLVRPWPWFLWLLFAALVAAILWRLLIGCAIDLGHGLHLGPAWCRPAVADAGRIRDLQGLVANLEEQVARTPAACRVAALPPRPDTVLPVAPPPLPPAASPDARDIGIRVDRESGQTGELQISLGWNGPADLDLYVTCPTGERIYHDHRSACGGRLDVDMNVPSRMNERPVENVTFPSVADIPRGTMRIGVAWYDSRGETRDVVPATVVIRRAGQPPQEIRVEMRRPQGQIPIIPVHEMSFPN